MVVRMAPCWREAGRCGSGLPPDAGPESTSTRLPRETPGLSGSGFPSGRPLGGGSPDRAVPLPRAHPHGPQPTALQDSHSGPSSLRPEGSLASGHSHLSPARSAAQAAGRTLSFLRALNFFRQSTVSCLCIMEATVERCWRRETLPGPCHMPNDAPSALQGRRRTHRANCAPRRQPSPNALCRTRVLPLLQGGLSLAGRGYRPQSPPPALTLFSQQVPRVPGLRPAQGNVLPAPPAY